MPSIRTKQEASGPPNTSNDESWFDYLFAYGVGLAVTFALGIAIYTYDRVGEDWVDSLDERIGEVVAGRARIQLRAGQQDEALESFQQALTVGFSDEIHRVWVSHDLARLHLSLGQYDEAVAVSRSCVDLPGENGEAFGIWHKALQEQQKSADALALTMQWYEWGQQRNQAASMAWAMFNRGLHLQSANQDDEALEAFEAGLRAKAGGSVEELLTRSIERLRSTQKPE